MQFLVYPERSSNNSDLRAWKQMPTFFATADDFAAWLERA
jgi:hypothetical protein